MHVAADDPAGLVGSICFEIYRWQPGWGPEVDWVIDASADHSRRVNSSEITCPAMGITLPATFSFTLPDVDEGTHLLSYRWTGGEDHSSDGASTASYVFHVDG